VPRIVYLVHALPPLENTGTPLAAYSYAQGLAQRGWEVTVVSAAIGETSWPTAPERNPPEAFDRLVVPPTRHLGSYWSIEAPSAPRRAECVEANTFRRLLQTIGPDLVHVVDNVHLPLDWPEIAAARGIPVVRTVSCAEDLCALVAPVSPCSGPKGFCAAPITPEHCARCVRAQLPGEYPPPVRSDDPLAAGSPRSIDDDQDQLLGKLRRKRVRATMQFRSVFDRIVFSGQGWRRYFEETLPLDPDRVRVIEMGLDLSAWSEAANQDRRVKTGEPVVFCLAASLDRAKGYDRVVQAFSSPALLGRNDYRLRILGGGEVELVRPLLDVNPNVDLIGPYRAEDLPALLADVHVGLSTSRFETFHRVSREYLAAGIPVIGNGASGFGIAEVVSPGRNGLLYDHADPAGLEEAVRSVLDDRGLLGRLTDGSRATRIRSIEDEVDDLVGLYAELIEERRSGSHGDPDWVDQRWAVSDR
jgi:glycosyltransferase involved in cell wall biosynthesis